MPEGFWYFDFKYFFFVLGISLVDETVPEEYKPVEIGTGLRSAYTIDPLPTTTNEPEVGKTELSLEELMAQMKSI